MNELDPSSNEVLRLVALLRQQDQLIFRMSQCNSWNGMQPIFRELLEGTMRRMQDESDRIRTLMIPEIRKAYLNDTPTYSIQSQSPRLEGPRDAGVEDTSPDRQLDQQNRRQKGPFDKP